MSKSIYYVVRNWKKKFEKADSRKCTNMRWVALPNQHDSKNFRRLAINEKNVEVWAAWTLILQVASKQSHRGSLVDEDGPIMAEDLAYMTGFPKQIFESAFPVLTTLGWLETKDYEKFRESIRMASG